jgi:hypothetical protein
MEKNRFNLLDIFGIGPAAKKRAEREARYETNKQTTAAENLRAYLDYTSRAHRNAKDYAFATRRHALAEAAVQTGEARVEDLEQKIHLSEHACIAVLLACAITVAANAYLEYTVLTAIMGNWFFGILSTAVMAATFVGIGVLLPGAVRAAMAPNRSLREILFALLLVAVIVSLAIPAIKNAAIRADISWEGKLQSAQVSLVEAEEDGDEMLRTLAENKIESIEKRIRDAKAWMRLLMAASLAGELLFSSLLGQSLAYLALQPANWKLSRRRRRADQYLTQIQNMDAAYEEATINDLMTMGLYENFYNSMPNDEARRNTAVIAPPEGAGSAIDSYDSNIAMYEDRFADEVAAEAVAPPVGFYDAGGAAANGGSETNARANAINAWDADGFNQA